MKANIKDLEQHGLNLDDVYFILESLEYTKKAFQEYPIGPNGYPNYEFKLKRLKDVESRIEKMRKIRDELKKNKKGEINGNKRNSN